MDHKSQYKHKQDTVDDLREKRRQEDNDLRKQRRERLANSKRVRLVSNAAELDDITVEEVKEAIQKLKGTPEERKTALIKLKRGFSQGTLYIDLFLSEEQALPALVGTLTGTDADLQIEAAWCLTNMAAGTEEHALIVIKQAAPYLITYISGNSPKLQDQCAWALGNLAADGAECRAILKAQGAIQPLVNLLKSSMPNVVRSAAFALSNLARGEDKDVKDLMDGGVVPLSITQMNALKDNDAVVAEIAWVLTYITARVDQVGEAILAEVLDNVVPLLISYTEEQPENFEVLTPLLRCLGNICSTDSFSVQACKNEKMLPAMCTMLQSHHRHIKKECLWALSNMTADENICKQIMEQDILTPLIHVLSTTFDIRKEAGYCVCNLACQGAEFCSKLVQQGALPGMVLLLKSSDVEALHLGLCFCEMVFRMVEDGVHMFEECHGLASLESLEYHNNQAIRTQTAQLLEKYFYKENEEAGQDKKEGGVEISEEVHT